MLASHDHFPLPLYSSFDDRRPDDAGAPLLVTSSAHKAPDMMMWAQHHHPAHPFSQSPPSAFAAAQHPLPPFYSSSAPHHAIMPDHLPTPSHTPTQDSFARHDARRPTSSQFGDRKSGHIAAHYSRQTGSGHSMHGQDLPVTPQTNHSDDFDHHQTSPGVAHLDSAANGWGQPDTSSAFRNVPKLDRTISDIYQDELYNPNFGAPPPPQASDNYSTSYLNSHPSLQQSSTMAAALQAAQQARSNSPHGDRYRDISPFCSSSQFASGYNTYPGQLPSAAATRQQQRQMASQQALDQYRSRREDSAPKTISPKDAVLDYHENNDSSQSLFPDASSSQQSAATMYGLQHNNAAIQQQFQPAQVTFQFAPAGMPTNSRFIPPQFQPQSSHSSVQSQPLELSSHMAAMESSHSEGSNDDDGSDQQEYESSPDTDYHMERPVDMMSDSGTYTCTYHGCHDRFTSPALLQKHKREDHRSTAPSHHQSVDSPNSNSATGMTQAGPHRCDRINPQTGKPCNTVFSRPYDLTRHEDTIHNRVKAKVRCHLCTEEKTFSRNDALTRHMKVVHPTVPWPSKQKRRGH